MAILEVSDDDICDLSDIQLTSLLDRLLHLEALKFGITPRGIGVGLQINVADGGEDGRIRWEGDPVDTDYLPSNFVQFQVKATQMGPAECANELVNNGQLKPMIRDALAEGAAYALFNSKNLNQAQIQLRIDRMRRRLIDLNAPNAEVCRIEIFSAEKIKNWVNTYISSIVAVSSYVGTPVLPGLKTFEEWNRSFDDFFEYIADEKRAADARTITTLFEESGEVCRIIGPSGLGKTRFALEVCRDINEKKRNVVYLDAAAGIPNLVGTVFEWVRHNLSGVVVVDNCDIQAHEQLMREVGVADSKLNLVTIHYSTEQGSMTQLIRLERLPDAVIKQMLEGVYENEIEDIDRIVNFAQGFPQMAVLLAEARLHAGPPVDMGSITNDHMLRKMLWGDDPPDDHKKRMLEACSLFDSFGVEGSAEVELRFIAESIANSDVDDLHRCIKEFEGKGLVNRAGRFVQVAPKPLAIRLAYDWWRNARQEVQLALVNSDMPGTLQVAFCEQIEKLDSLPEVKQLTADMCDINTGPFGKAEVILSDRGSRLFRSLAVVNPEATSAALSHVFQAVETGNFKEIEGDTRRNLVWALERLCFHQSTFAESINSLLQLAVEENENWANNATGLFKQLFGTFISGTEAPPEVRLRFIDQLLGSGDPARISLAIEALGSAIDSRGSTRTVGAEYQGAGVPLKEWRPQIWKEAFDYWIECIRRLAELAGNGDSNAKATLGNHIRPLATRNLQVTNALDEAIRMVVERQGPLWLDAIESIKNIKRFDLEGVPDEAKNLILSWEKLLQPTDIDQRLDMLVTNAIYDHEQNDQGEYEDLSAQRAAALGNELASPLQIEERHLRRLLGGEQRQAFAFGKSLYQATDEPERLLSEVLKIIESIEYPNLGILLGIASAQFELGEESWASFVKIFTTDPHDRHFVRVVTVGDVSEQQLDTAYDLLVAGRLKNQEIGLFKYGRALGKVATPHVCNFVEKVSDLSQENAWIALSVLVMHCHGNAERWAACRDTFRKLTLTISLTDEKIDTHVGHEWQAAVERVLAPEDVEYSVELCRIVVPALAKDLDYSFEMHYLAPVLAKVFQMHGAHVWPIFMEAIEAAKPMEEFHIMQIFDKNTVGRRREVGLLHELPEGAMEDWCRRYPNKAPALLARVIEPIVEEEDETHLSPEIQFLIDQYGDDAGVLSEISANLGSFSWTGSLVPFYRRQLEAIMEVADHPNPQVRNWVARNKAYFEKQLESERERDEESELGKF